MTNMTGKYVKNVRHLSEEEFSRMNDFLMHNGNTVKVIGGSVVEYGPSGEKHLLLGFDRKKAELIYNHMKDHFKKIVKEVSGDSVDMVIVDCLKD